MVGQKQLSMVGEVGSTRGPRFFTRGNRASTVRRSGPHQRPRLLRDALQPLASLAESTRPRCVRGSRGIFTGKAKLFRETGSSSSRTAEFALDGEAASMRKLMPVYPLHRQALRLGPAEGRRRGARPGHRRARRAHPRAARAVRGARRHAGAALDPRAPTTGSRSAPPASGSASRRRWSLQLVLARRRAARPRPGRPGPPARRRAAGRLRRAAAVRADRRPARDRRPDRGELAEPTR